MRKGVPSHPVTFGYAGIHKNAIYEVQGRFKHEVQLNTSRRSMQHSDDLQDLFVWKEQMRSVCLEGANAVLRKGLKYGTLQS